MWHEVDLDELDRDQYTLVPMTWTAEQVESIVVFERLRLYNRDLPCGAVVLRKRLDEHYCVHPMPPLWRIGEILRRHGLTYACTGEYPLDHPHQNARNGSGKAGDINPQCGPVLKPSGSSKG